jgi:general nucleoside transport system ATP-binding protein
LTESVLRLQGITKRFGTLLANDSISLELQRGEVLALLGENGAGKSTLVAILFGHYVADAGTIEAFGAPLPPGQPRAALAAGIGMVHQHSTLADNLSVLDNVMVGSEPLWRPWSRRSAARARLLSVAQRFGLTVQPDARVGDLSVGERQRVEILKALMGGEGGDAGGRGARILILDEPTAVLTPQESEALFHTLAQMVAQGLAIIFISHKLDEVLRVSNRIAVLRAGKLVAQANAAEVNASQLALWMVGHAVAPPAQQPQQQQRAQPNPLPTCVLEGVHTWATGRERLAGVSLALHGGEIVAIAGVSGNGQLALAEVLCGTRRVTAGLVRWPELGDAGAPAGPAALVEHGVARIPEDRQGTGAIGDLSLWENACAERFGSAHFSRRALGIRWLRRSAARAHAQRLTDRFDVRGAGLDSPARALSGGNLQKLILARALIAPDGRPARLIVAHQPSWGLDVGAVAFVQAQLLAARDAGAAVLLISDDLDEVLALGNRIAVLYRGQLTPARPASDWSRESLGLAMAGAAAAAAA